MIFFFMKSILGDDHDLILHIHVTLRSGKTHLVGEDTWRSAIKMYVDEPPRDGRANREILKYLDSLLDDPAATIELKSGHATRSKQIHIRGVSRGTLEARIKKEVAYRGHGDES